MYRSREPEEKKQAAEGTGPAEGSPQEAAGVPEEDVGSAKKWPKPLQAAVQAAFASGFFLLLLLAYFFIRSEIAILCLAASAFIAFAFPRQNSSKPKVLIGGYALGVVFGLACVGIMSLVAPNYPNEMHVVIVFCAISLFFTAFFMILFKVQHPPAASLALSVVVAPQALEVAIGAMICIVALTLVKWALYKPLGRYLD